MENNEESFNVYNISYENKLLPKEIQNNIKNNNNNKDNYHFNYNSPVDELNDSIEAEIEYQRGLNMKKVYKDIYNCHSPETFEIFVTSKKGGKRQIFKCIQRSSLFQRYCVGTAKRQFDMDIYYNTSNGMPQFGHYPYVKIQRINGGCCSGKAKINIFNKDNEFIGSIEETYIKNCTIIRKKNNNVKYYIVILPFKKKKRYCANLCSCCCCCSDDDISDDELEKVHDRLVIINEKEERVGQMKDYPFLIKFPQNADYNDKILLILSRIFILYVSDKADTLRGKMFEAILCCFCQKAGSDIFDENPELKKIKDVYEKWKQGNEIYDNVNNIRINKNLVKV